MLTKYSVTDPVPIPHEDGKWMRFRRLTPDQLGEARQQRQVRATERMLSLDPAVREMLLSSQEPKTEPPDDKPKPKPKPTADDVLLLYDRTLLLAFGIAEWNYLAPDGTVIPVESASVEDLDWITSAWAARQILDHNRLLPGQWEDVLGE